MGTKNRPILFSAEMVRAILDGRKIQTRRITKPPTPYDWGDDIIAEWYAGSIKCSYGKVGDRLWVRETFGIFDVDADEDIAICYRADDSDAKWFKNKRQYFNDLRLGKWRSPIHLYKWAARLWLEITNIRVERVQDISLDDVYGEGIQYDDHCGRGHLRDKFKSLWDSLNTKQGYGWDENPFVWCISFKRIEMPKESR